jgi:hypothetical protein
LTKINNYGIIKYIQKGENNLKFLVKHALGGGFGGCEREDGEVIDCESEDEAYDYAFDAACQDYDSYDGMHGLRSVDMIMDEDGIDDYDYAYEIWE